MVFQAVNSREPSSGSGWPTILLAPLVAVASVVAYSSSLHGPFLLDDVPRIVEDARLRSAWPPWPILASSNRPFAHYTFALNYAWHGHEVLGYHITNLAIHVLAAWTLLGIVRRSWLLLHPEQTQTALALALAIALLWAVHPLNTQAVSYIVQRLEAMMGLFYLLTLYGFIRAQQSSRFRYLWYGLSIACCGLGMGCKEVMVTAPVVVLWFDRALVAASWRELWQRRWRYYMGLIASWGVLAWAMLHFQDDYRGGGLLQVEGLTPWLYLINQARVIVHYLQLLCWPVGQCAYYSWPIETSLWRLWPYVLGISLAVIFSVVLAIRRPALGWIAISFFIILAPTSSVVPIVDLAFEHRMYLPSAAALALLVLVVAKLCGLLDEQTISVPKQFAGGQRACGVWLARGLLASGLLACVAAALVMTTYARNRVYSSQEYFWRDVTEKAPHNFNGWLGLGTVLAESDRAAEAEACTRRALEIAPNEARPQATLAGILIAQGQYDHASELLYQASRTAPNLPEVVINYGLLLSLTGKFAEAQPYLEAGLEVAPEDEELHTNLIVNLCYLQRFEEALQRALDNQSRRPHSVRSVTDVAACHLASGDPLSAERIARQALQLDDHFARAHATLGMALADRDVQAAITCLMRACQLDNQSYEFHLALGNLQLSHQPSAAVSAYRQAATLRPQDIETKLRLAMAYDASGRPDQAIPLLEEALAQQPELSPVRAYLRSLKQKQLR